MEKRSLASEPPGELSKGQNAPRLQPGLYPDSTVRTDQAAMLSPMHPAPRQRKLREVVPTGCPILVDLPVTRTQPPEPGLWGNFVTTWPGSVS